MSLPSIPANTRTFRRWRSARAAVPLKQLVLSAHCSTAHTVGAQRTLQYRSHRDPTLPQLSAEIGTSMCHEFSKVTLFKHATATGGCPASLGALVQQVISVLTGLRQTHNPRQDVTARQASLAREAVRGGGIHHRAHHEPTACVWLALAVVSNKLCCVFVSVFMPDTAGATVDAAASSTVRQLLAALLSQSTAPCHWKANQASAQVHQAIGRAHTRSASLVATCWLHRSAAAGLGS